MSEWRDISTAPKTGEKVLLTDGHNVYFGQWSDEADYGCGEDRRPGWQLWECEDSWYSVAANDFIKWMPAPTPPAAS